MAERSALNSGGDGATGAMPSGKVGSVQSPLVDQIGGPEAMASILVPAVEIFYVKLLGDPRINEFFAGVDTERLKNKQVEFMAFVFGSPERYTGKDIAQAHQRLIDEKGLNETHFDIVIDHFVATLKELNVPGAILDQAVAILMTSRPVFERRPTEEDKFKAAMKMLKECAHQKERALRDARGHLAQMGVTERGQMELVRGAVKMRGGDPAVDEVLAGLIDKS
ncbi:MAG: group 1 truncated hemoglobin [bacterium]